ncbi:MAG: DUF3313 domain-containing protein [Candidatus Omnitrophica bacterium]|nr:DUF3313 domain-containing protein [Candidatus Omnitrophota bacterium]
MKKRLSLHSKLLLINVAFIFALTGCAAKEVKLTETGFLSSYSDLEPDMDSQGMYVYRNPNVNIAERYSQILIAPVQFKLDFAVKADTISDGDRNKLADHFYQELKAGLEKKHTITGSPGEDVLLLRVAVTDILPNTVWLNIHWSTTLIGGGIGGASLEAELVDSITGERMMSFVDARRGKNITQKLTVPNYAKGLTKWGHTKGVLKVWADIIVENLDQLRERYEAGI